MRHDEAFDRLIDIVTLPPGERAEDTDAAVLAHAARCATCSARLATLTRVDRSLLGAARDQHAIEEPTPALERRVLAIPLSRRSAPRRGSFRTRTAAISASAVLALAIGLPVWLGSRESSHARAAAIRLPLRARSGSLSGTVVLGSRAGNAQSVRLMADGLETGKATSYSVWLTGPGGNVLIRSFSANAEGGCDIRADAPDGRWNGLAITMNGQPPLDSAILARATIPN